MDIGHTSMSFDHTGYFQAELALTATSIYDLEEFIKRLQEDEEGKPVLVDFDYDMYVLSMSKPNDIRRADCTFYVADSESLVHWLLSHASCLGIGFEMWIANIDLHCQENAYSNYAGWEASYIRKNWYAEVLENDTVVEEEIGGFKNFGKFKKTKAIYAGKR